ncbi:zinc ribbon domain-containing protein [Rhodoferax sp.]|uniref:double zinc ribbon domain-containing protein n=1 Tax=Rhodoferax sp. TaxID=50421 RepID=UPI0025CBDB96|nr:zinc ribbon domain-containing protein [Rhodoferax sp.]MBU3996845.1 zinc ribbon domain-containing protein [Gammaproteobacteria bacterium]MBU4081043.1 zinc ribbon domain-containing protein [Gammaproteobacteria bacterium]MBU4111985.1 zinc ribbon domain-containing protein [Gammaproteobacteria bacterium]MBU4171391.1 zinc ribbon domain-containing protein [Gammaproteobacteria bacterium]
MQCLFCKHLNPAGASFCNDCGSQLNLQPCGQCGAIDDRAAKHCYKCGADFSLPAASGLEAQFTPVSPETEPTYPALIGANVAQQQAAPSVVETVSTDAGTSPTGAQRAMRVTLPVLLLALMAASFYLYSRPSAQLPRSQDLPRAAPIVSAAPTPAETTEIAPAARSEPKLAQTGQRPQIAASTVDLDKTPPVAAPVVGTRRRSGPALVAVPEAQSRQDSLVIEDCPPAVATLGLCNPTPKKEGQ